MAELLKRRGISPGCIAETVRLISFTRHDRIPKYIDEEILCDIDLMILGAAKNTFDAYENGIRKEYAWVPDEIYRRERVKVLNGFLARPRIYYRPKFFEKYEARARGNLRQLIARLAEPHST